MTDDYKDWNGEKLLGWIPESLMHAAAKTQEPTGLGICRVSLFTLFNIGEIYNISRISYFDNVINFELFIYFY